VLTLATVAVYFSILNSTFLRDLNYQWAAVNLASQIIALCLIDPVLSIAGANLVYWNTSLKQLCKDSIVILDDYRFVVKYYS
jgi:hypothetical protein